MNDVDRSTHIGGSDVAAILNLSPWGTPWSVFAEKVGLTTSHIDNQERLDLGKDAETYLATVYMRHHPHLHLGDAQASLTHPEYPWLRGHADGFVLEAADGDISDAVAGWEAKTDNAFTPWEKVPAHYQAQAQTYMLLTGLPEWHFTVGFARWQVEHYVLAADEVDQRLIIDRTRDFWTSHVLTGTPPPTDGHQATTDALSAAWSEHEEGERADVDLADVEAWQALTAEIKDLKETLAATKNRLAAALTTAEIGCVGGAPTVTYRSQTKKSTCAECGHVEESDPFRVLRSAPKKLRGT